MPIVIEVQPQAQFAQWIASKGGKMPGAKPLPTARPGNTDVPAIVPASAARPAPAPDADGNAPPAPAVAGAAKANPAPAPRNANVANRVNQ
jgi:cytochrome c oxidase subunit 2